MPATDSSAASIPWCHQLCSPSHAFYAFVTPTPTLMPSTFAQTTTFEPLTPAPMPASKLSTLAPMPAPEPSTPRPMPAPKHSTLTEFAQPYVHTDVWSVICQLSTSSGFTWLKEIFPEDMILPEVTPGDARLRLHLPPSFSQDTLLVIWISQRVVFTTSDFIGICLICGSRR